MKTQAYIITAFIFCHVLLQGCSSAARQKEAEKDLKVKDFHGKVKSLRERHYMADEEGGKVKKRILFDEAVGLYNEKGQVIEKSEYNNADGSLTYKWLYEYDENGALKEIKRFDENGQYDRRHVFTHDDRGNEKGEWIYDADSILRSQWSYGYDTQGNQTEVNEHGIWGVRKKEYQYDDKGNITREVIYTPEGSVEYTYTYEYRYTFDKKKNWIKKVIYANDSPLEIVEREIEYDH